VRRGHFENKSHVSKDDFYSKKFIFFVTLEIVQGK